MLVPITPPPITTTSARARKGRCADIGQPRRDCRPVTRANRRTRTGRRRSSRSASSCASGCPGVHNLPAWEALRESPIRLVGVRHEQTAVYAADGHARATGQARRRAHHHRPGRRQRARRHRRGVGVAARRSLVIATDIPIDAAPPGRLPRRAARDARPGRDVRAGGQGGRARGRRGRDRRRGRRARRRSRWRRPPARSTWRSRPTCSRAAATSWPTLTVRWGSREPDSTDVRTRGRSCAPRPSGRCSGSAAAPRTRATGVARAGRGARRAGDRDLPRPRRAGPGAPVVARAAAAPARGRRAVGRGRPGRRRRQRPRRHDDPELRSSPSRRGLVALNVDAADATKNYTADVVIERRRGQTARRWRTRCPAAPSRPTSLPAVRASLDRLRRDRARRPRLPRRDAEAARPRHRRLRRHVHPRLLAGGAAPVRAAAPAGYPIGWGTLGFGFPARIGAALAQDDPVLCVCGDGGFLFAAGELAIVDAGAGAADDPAGGRRRLRHAALRPAAGRRRAVRRRPGDARLARSWQARSASSDEEADAGRRTLRGRVLRRPCWHSARRPRSVVAATPQHAATRPSTSPAVVPAGVDVSRHARRRRRVRRRLHAAPAPPRRDWAAHARARAAAARSSRSAASSRPTRRRSRGSSRARSASRSPSRAARCRRSSTPATSSSARAAGCTARPCRRRCPTSSCSRSATRSAWPRSSPPATSRSRCRRWYIVPALLCGNAVVWKPAEYTPAIGDALTSLFQAGGLPEGVLNTVLHRRPRPRSPGSSRRSTRGWSTRSASPARARSAREIGELCGRHLQIALPRARRQEPARRDARRRPRPGRRGRAVLRLRHRRPALHVARHGDRARVGPRRLPGALHAARSRRPRSATRSSDVVYGPMITQRFADRFEEFARPGRGPPRRVTARPAPGASPPTTRARASSATPPRALLPPDDRERA